MDDNNVHSSFSTIASEIMNKWVLKADVGFGVLDSAPK